MNKTAVLEVINTCLGNKNIEGFITDIFEETVAKKPQKYDLSFYSNRTDKGKGGIFIRIINSNDVFNHDKICELFKWTKDLHTKKEGERYVPYGPDYLCLCVAFNSENIEPNIIQKDKLYYTEKDIFALYTNLLKEDFNNVKEKTNNQTKVKNIIYNHNTSWEVYKKFSNNNINKLYSIEFDSKDFIGRSVASCMDYNPISFYDAANHYFTYAESNKHLYIIERGLTKSELIELANRFARRVKEVTKNEFSMSVEEAFHYLMYNIINKTFVGYFAEKTLADIFIKEGCLVFKPNANLDQNYGMDLKIVNDNKEFAIQVKPKWFLKTINEEDINKIKEQYNKTLREQNLETFYAFYSMDKDSNYTWDISDNGSCLFNINFIEKLN